ncbi:MAG: hypothetical protein R3E77_09695 [Steroidobacteraceae bacterium]
MLDVPLRRLRLTMRNSAVERGVDQLRDELQRRGIRFKPHAWISDEWFSPDGVPGIAVPFYLIHPRLKRIERTHTHMVEGGNHHWLMRILRHEAGHAIDTAYGLRRRKDWRRIFGHASAPYPSTYISHPSSRRYVLHLGHWYAQAHPTEDFAETFAVWLQPRARWRRDYQGWPALRKLEYIERLMAEIRRTRPRCTNRSRIEPLGEKSQTLAQYYKRKAARYDFEERRYDRMLQRAYAARRGARCTRASRFVREMKPQLHRLLTRRARLHPYLVDHAIDSVANRLAQLRLCIRGDRRKAKRVTVRLLERIVLDIMRRNRENYAL